jgi:diguanylate cyclase (GGDEF)-like protein
MRERSTKDRTPASKAHDPVSAMMSSLLTVHSAMTQDWLVDAACTAAERGLNAAFAFVFFEEQDGSLVYKAPASDLRRRGHQRAADALGGALFRGRVDPKETPAIAEALDTGSPVLAPFPEFFGPSMGQKRAIEAAVALTVGAACVVPMENAGERIGALLVLGDSTMPAAHVRLLADHIACASANLRDAASGREQGVIDVVRSVFDARKLESELQRELTRAVRYKREVSICVIEATNLRLLRERFGRFLTDRLLQRLGEGLAQHARDVDLIGAYKESGYTMILMEAASDGAEVAARRLMDTAMRTALDDGENVPGLELHLAVGYATCPEDGTTSDSLFAAAEMRMYGGQTQVA